MSDQDRLTVEQRYATTRLKDAIWAVLIQVYGGRPLNSLADTDIPEAIDALITAVRSEADVAKASLAIAIEAHVKREDWWKRQWDGMRERAEAAEAELTAVRSGIMMMSPLKISHEDLSRQQEEQKEPVEPRMVQCRSCGAVYESRNGCPNACNDEGYG